MSSRSTSWSSDWRRSVEPQSVLMMFSPFYYVNPIIRRFVLTWHSHRVTFDLLTVVTVNLSLQLTSFDRTNSDVAKIRGLSGRVVTSSNVVNLRGSWMWFHELTWPADCALCSSSHREVGGLLGERLGRPLLPRLWKQIQHSEQTSPLSPLWLHHVSEVHGVRPLTFGPYVIKTHLHYLSVTWSAVVSQRLLWKTCLNEKSFCNFLGVFYLTEKLINGTREALCVHGSPPSHSQSLPAGVSSSSMGSRRGSISSLSSVTSMLEEKDDEKIRCCHHCMDTLVKRQQKLGEKEHTPAVVKLYEVRTRSRLHQTSNVAVLSFVTDRTCGPDRGWGCAWRRWTRRLRNTSGWPSPWSNPLFKMDFGVRPGTRTRTSSTGPRVVLQTIILSTLFSDQINPWCHDNMS